MFSFSPDLPWRRKGSNQANAVDLNIKLMKWRVLPGLEPDRLKERLAWDGWEGQKIRMTMCIPQSKSVFRLQNFSRKLAC